MLMRRLHALCALETLLGIVERNNAYLCGFDIVLFDLPQPGHMGLLEMCLLMRPACPLLQ